MISKDITPENKAIPDISVWVKTSTSTVLCEQNANFIEKLRRLEREFKVRSRLDPYDIHNNKWSSEMLQTVYEASYPLKPILESKTTIKISSHWLGFWEVFSQSIVPDISEKIEYRLSENSQNSRVKRPSGTTFRSFHIQDNFAESVHSLQKSLNKVEYSTHSQIKWDWLATYDDGEKDLIEMQKNKDKWITGIDGDNGSSPANMRSWKNKIITRIKGVDIITSGDENEEDISSNIAFSLMNLSTGGYAVLKIPRIESTSAVSMIHLFSHCFERTKLFHTVADDKTFLYGSGFLNNLSSKHYKLLFAFCESSYESSNLSLFNNDHMYTDLFINTVEDLTKFSSKIHNIRYDYYAKLLNIYEKLYKSAANKTFESYEKNILDDAYPEKYNKWITATNFNFFSNVRN